jgi:hypothetical protein
MNLPRWIGVHIIFNGQDMDFTTLFLMKKYGFRVFLGAEETPFRNTGTQPITFLKNTKKRSERPISRVPCLGGSIEKWVFFNFNFWLCGMDEIHPHLVMQTIVHCLNPIFIGFLANGKYLLFKDIQGSGLGKKPSERAILKLSSKRLFRHSLA